MRKNNRKGFTIVELVIVIAVIAILAGVLIPTFSGIVEKAKQSAVQQKAAAVYKEVYAIDLSDGKIDYDITSAKYAEAGGVLPAGGSYTYSASSFVYVADGYTATYTYNNNTWAVAKPAKS